MTPRDRYRQLKRCEPGLQPPNMDHGPLLDTWERWLREGLNPNLDPRDYDAWCEAFGIDRYYCCVSIEPPRQPLFAEEILAESQRTVTRRQADGSIIEENKSTSKTIPHELRPAIVDRDDWERLKAWLDVDGPLPPADSPAVQATFQRAREADVPVRLSLGSLVGTPRNWLGFQAFAMLPYDDPEWFEDLLETQCHDAERRVRYFGEAGVPLDCLHFWEDICFKSGPIVSPAIFATYAVPRYRRVVELARAYGYDQISVDSDGNIDALLPHWLEAGVSLIWPLEVQAGMDVNQLQAQYPGRTVWMGGIHKYRLTEGQDAIAAELMRVKPAVDAGGYIPMLDHNCPADVPLDHYLIYLRLRHEILGLGDRLPDETRIRRACPS